MVRKLRLWKDARDLEAVKELMSRVTLGPVYEPKLLGGSAVRNQTCPEKAKQVKELLQRIIV